MTLACFDLDGTLVAGDSFRRYLRFLLDRAYLPILGAPRLGAAVLGRRLRLISLHRAKELTLSALRGLPRATIEAWGREYWHHALAPALRPEIVRRLQAHLNAGDRVAILTAAPDAYLSAFAESLGVSDAYGTPLLYEDDRFTGRLGPHLFGAAKVALLQTIAGAETPAAVTCYSDHHADIPLLRAATHAVAVAPSAELRAQAVRSGWEVIEATDGAG